jgi:hypothetical protein
VTAAKRNDSDGFLYFGFGSNLDVARLRIHCPSAELISTARLADHRLAFTLESKRNWLGGVADILPEPGAEVWGALWHIDVGESEELDRQEGLFRDPPAYHRVALEVATPPGELVACRSYRVVTPDVQGFAPSPAYKATLLRGARALGLPPAYIAGLKALADNGRAGGGPA